MKPTITKTQCQRWIADLRSGNFIQGREQLRAELDGHFEYCCLGVLGEQLDLLDDIEDMGTEWLSRSEDDYDETECILGYTPEGTAWETTLAKLNDGGILYDASIGEYAARKERDEKTHRLIIPPHTFEEIADIIEKNLLPECSD